MQPPRDAAALAGTEIRRARHGLRLRQREVAKTAGCSQATISRLELGLGSSFSMALWSAVADAVGRRLMIQLLPRSPDVVSDPSLAVRCHRTVIDVARQGGWAAVTEIERRIDREAIETVLDRGPERVVVHAWDVVGDVDSRIEALTASVHRRSAVGAPPAGGLIVVPSSIGNRRRLTEARHLLDATLPALAAHWDAALRNPSRSMPSIGGVLWTDRRGERLLLAPLVPGWAWVTPDHASRALRRRAR